MKGALFAASALLGSAAASHGAHQAFHARRGTGGAYPYPTEVHYEEVCGTTTVTVYGDATLAPMAPPPAPPVANVSVPVSVIYVTPSPVKPAPTAEVTICPTPGTYTFPAKTTTIVDTTTVCGDTVTVVPSGTHSYGAVVTSVSTATTVTCPYAAVETEGTVVTSVVKTTTYVCPSAGEYTVIPPKVTECSESATIVYPTVSVITPGVYTKKEETVTVVKTSQVYVCPYETVVVSPSPKPEAPKSTPVYEAPKPSTPAYEAPKSSAPVYEAPKPSTPAYETPKSSAPVYEAPKLSTPAYEAPKSSAPVYEAPKPSTPAYEAPKSSAPVYEAPKPSTPAYEAPKSSAPAYSAPAYTPVVSSKSVESVKPKPSDTPSYGGSGRVVTKGDKWAMTYTPYTKDGQCKSKSEVDSDISEIAKLGFTTIRCYSTDCGVFENVAPACKSHGLKIILGIFFEAGGKGPFSDYAEKQLTEIKNGAPKDDLVMVIVGNECIFNGICDAEQLGSYIDHVRTELHGCGFSKEIAITTTEPVNIWEEKGAALCSHIDVFTCQVHPFFTSRITPSEAGEFAAQQLEQAAKVCPEAAKKGKYITEIGWPSQGETNGAAIPGPSQQKEAIKSILAKVGKESVLFSFQDDSWKPYGAFGVERYFGCKDALSY
jgi:exo-beta-1,3-glucanase (GH17 family)